MADSVTKKLRPIEAFVKYVLDVKPYHTKLLEVVERYNFEEELSVDFTETSFTDVTYKNVPLCRPVGFGLVFDSCGYSADSCCDLFQCIGGYGLIFDNSDLLAQHTIADIHYPTDQVIINGNWIYDRRIEILEISGDTVYLRGDHAAEFITHRQVIVAPYNVHQLKSFTPTTISVEGDRAAEFLAKREFRIVGTRGLDGEYGVTTASYDETNNVTIITPAGNQNLAAISITGGYVETEAQATNQGGYTVDNAVFDGNNTILKIKGQFPTVSTKNNGSLQLRTALVAPRHIWLKDGVTNDIVEFRIAESFYDVDNDRTHIIVAETLYQEGGNFNPTEVRLHGYMTTSGYDNDEECDRPKPTNIHTTFGEKLVIRVIVRPEGCGTGDRDRITESGFGRITESGECRIIEDQDAEVPVGNSIVGTMKRVTDDPDYGDIVYITEYCGVDTIETLTMDGDYIWAAGLGDRYTCGVTGIAAEPYDYERTFTFIWDDVNNRWYAPDTADNEFYNTDDTAAVQRCFINGVERWFWFDNPQV